MRGLWQDPVVIGVRVSFHMTRCFLSSSAWPMQLHLQRCQSGVWEEERLNYYIKIPSLKGVAKQPVNYIKTRPNLKITAAFLSSGEEVIGWNSKIIDEWDTLCVHKETLWGIFKISTYPHMSQTTVRTWKIQQQSVECVREETKISLFFFLKKRNTREEQLKTDANQSVIS